ncbi:PREDICTED: heat shock 70 kDa protein 12B-like [Amphimedon queenslandica]|uniref:Heat shock 70 kDa protein 12A n=1 Tax=Amphimedon queenslandica TaxID=400682 RepID=A0AAN0JS65_AMPQE|nr:PREDICTED: heat shock 70 kDa protein 12B-like [Amphimedon queenslandica]|eukprot:XP_019859931.1 PREDICTED: heat shock 70 kDa protein 12B-like [Amphimedon queenslandica]
MALSKGPLSRAEKIPRAPPVLQDSSCIAAIDFGTSSLSVAYTTPTTGGDVKVLALHSTLERIPNAILILKGLVGQQHTTIGIGNQAQSLYSSMRKDAKKFIYFERIKKLLEKDNSLDRTTEVPSFTGGSYYLIEVIAFILTHLKEKLLTHFRGDYKSSDFDWVITVPAIWKARARRMMREAAYMAGLTSDAPGITRFTPVGSPLPRPEEVNPQKLSLALEPEVAAIAAQHQSEVSGSPPQRYMVVDIGGGTVDITVHDKSNGRISVVLPPMGNTWGGTTVNEALSMLLQEILKDQGFESFLKSDPISANATLNKFFYEEFEKHKKVFGDTIVGLNEVVISLPSKLVQFYGSDKLNETNQMNMHYDPGDGSLTIGYDQLEEKVFQFTVDKIIECVRAAFDELKSDGIDTVYLVGGFGGCRFVSRKIEEAIAQHRGILYDKIVCPVQPDLAVVSGAVMWRKDPNIIQSRVADATYGTIVAPAFDPSIHDEHYKFVDEDGKQRCNSVFKVFVLKGEEIKDELYKATFMPLQQKKTQQSIFIYCTADDGVQYIEDKEGKLTVCEIGKLALDIPNPDNIPNDERKFDVFMDFSGTEIQARAQYRITGEEVKTVCDFLSNQDKTIRTNN